MESEEKCPTGHYYYFYGTGSTEEHIFGIDFYSSYMDEKTNFFYRFWWWLWKLIYRREREKRTKNNNDENHSNDLV